jgi:hypothetical protein
MKNTTILLTIAVLLAACAGQADLPTVTTDEVTAITYNSATVNATVTDDGGAPIEARGVCYSTSPQPSLDNGTCTSNDRGTGSFSAEINNLSTNTTYYTRAYATNSEGTGYGNELSLNTEVFEVSVAIGDTFGGGILAYVLQPGDQGYDANTPHGIIAAPTDQSTGAEWGCQGTYIGGTQTGIGYGAANTTVIINGCAQAGIAARVCGDLVLNGYSDWYLPSIDELEQLYVNLFANGIGGFNSANYWSSTEGSADDAWKFNFSNGYANDFNKFNTFYVRAVRAF